MPVASGIAPKYHYLDHDTDYVNEAPPVQNQWYTVFDAEDVRLLWCVIWQSNVEALAKWLEVKWTIDGNEYLWSMDADNITYAWIYREPMPSTGGTAGLFASTAVLNAGYFVDKRGQHFKVEVRIRSVPGTNQILRCWCVRETLEVT